MFMRFFVMAWHDYKCMILPHLVSGSSTYYLQKQVFHLWRWIIHYLKLTQLYIYCSLINMQKSEFFTNIIYASYSFLHCLQLQTAAVGQWVRALAPQPEGWVFESKPDLSRKNR